MISTSAVKYNTLFPFAVEKIADAQYIKSKGRRMI